MINAELNDAALYDLLTERKATLHFCGQLFTLVVVGEVTSDVTRVMYCPANGDYKEEHIMYIGKAEVIELLRMGVVLIKGFRNDTLRIEAKN
ncbi:MAG: hypothetical protein PHN69_04455 [Candidatus Pacebacteria bacterium]|nr:hypothetical protein [Fermentimonas sp.]MDD4804405.1 hypothetical protein [Candidatus Paceibacterota bacterium]